MRSGRPRKGIPNATFGSHYDPKQHAPSTLMALPWNGRSYLRQIRADTEHPVSLC